MTNSDWQNEWQNEWRPSEKDLLLNDLAKRYHEETEAFDRTICTGPIVHGAILPMTPQESAAINRNAIAVRRRLEVEAFGRGIAPGELWRAISRYGRSYG